jgi:hypothetical protein
MPGVPWQGLSSDRGRRGTPYADRPIPAAAEQTAETALVMLAPPLSAAIGVELRRAWERLGGHVDELPELGHGPVPGLYGMFLLRNADSELLALLNAYGDTLPDDAVLKHLREWNASRPTIAPVVRGV